VSGTGPELGKTEPSKPSRPPPAPEDRVAEALERVQTTIIRSVAIATLLILAALTYFRCSDPFWRCKDLADEGISGSEIEVWEDLECNEWPGI
jgi:hypothetical protein